MGGTIYCIYNIYIKNRKETDGRENSRQTNQAPEIIFPLSIIFEMIFPSLFMAQWKRTARLLTLIYTGIIVYTNHKSQWEFMQLGSSGIDRGYGGKKLAWYSDDLHSVLPVREWRHKKMMEENAMLKKNKYTVTISFVWIQCR